VRKTRVTAGAPPTVTFEHNGAVHEIKPRLVIAADGRHGKTAQQAGIKFGGDPAHHWFSGMLIENIHDWPAETQTVGVSNGMNFFVFPQGNGRARLYQGVALADKERFMGEDAPRRFADSFRMSCLPNPDAIASGAPASHCFVYPNNDTWSEEPFVPGVVAIGDAAGHNDPIIGQGLSISHRDVRMVTDILKSTRDWSPGALHDYAKERRERLRRLRLSGRFMSVRDCEFDAAGRARRKRLHESGMSNPMIVGLTMATIVGPDVVPAEAFNEQALDALLAA
jgi:2-polyprenyl-6-methoxyphenol hydroxylase-like FAD-dependent oxidoreductase